MSPLTLEEISIALLNSSTIRSELILHGEGVLSPVLPKPRHSQGSHGGGEQRGSSATRSSSKSRFPGNWKNQWKFALSSALKRGRHDPYAGSRSLLGHEPSRVASLLSGESSFTRRRTGRMLFQILLLLLKIQRGWFALSEAMGRSETHANVRESLEGLHTPTSKWLLGGVGESPSTQARLPQAITVLGFGRVL